MASRLPVYGEQPDSSPGSVEQVPGAGADNVLAPVTCNEPATIPSQEDNARKEISQEEIEGAEDPESSSMPPPPTPSASDETRSRRSTSSASRNPNRLSLTLPIAPPTSAPSRPTPTSSVTSTPVDTSALNSPLDANDFIIAIAAQERRVLELREELGQAERELTRLKKQWSASEAYKKRLSGRNTEQLRTMASAGEETPTGRQSLDIDRKKALLLGKGPAKERKRTVMRGGHTRALSLLSPGAIPSDIANFQDLSAGHSPDLSPMPFPTPTPGNLAKRATWTPRQAQTPTGVKQMANDFKQGLWTFVEDLRQAAVGDEAISATSNRSSELAAKPSRDLGDQETIRASSTNRGRIPFENLAEAATNTPTRSASFQQRAQHRRSASKPESKLKKHYSWTPLTYDAFDDEDWSNWDSPTVKTSRWSGSTVNGDIIPAIPEKGEENEGTLRRKRSRSELRSSEPQTPAKLEELSIAVLNRLTPSNIKKSATEFIREWEKSLSPPPQDGSGIFESRIPAQSDS